MSGIAHADWEDGFTFMKFTSYRPVTLDLARVNTEDDYLVELARAGDLNLIADVTDVAPKPFDSFVYQTYAPGLPADQPTPILERAFGTYRETNDMAIRRSDLRTFLFWKRPDGLALGRKLANYEPQPIVSLQKREQAQDEIRKFYQKQAEAQANEEQPVPAQPLQARRDTAMTDYSRWQSARLAEALHLYYQRAYGWNGREGQFGRRVLLRELPSPLRQEIIRWLRENTQSSWLPKDTEDAQLSTEKSRVEVYKTWFSDEFWQQARLWIPKSSNGLSLRVGLPKAGNSEFQQQIAFLPRPVRNDSSSVSQQTLENWRRQAAEPQGVQNEQFTNRAVTRLGVPDKLISLEAKHKSLTALLNDVKIQCGVKLETTPELVATTLITARVKDMALADLMDNLSRMFDAFWQQKAGVWELNPIKRDEIDHLLMRIGDPAYFDSTLRDIWDASQGRGEIDWGYTIVEGVGLEKLQKSGGVPVSVLPPKTLAALRAMMEKNFAAELIQAYLPLSPVLEADGHLLAKHIEVGRPAAKGKGFVVDSAWTNISLSTSSFGALDIPIAAFNSDTKLDDLASWPKELQQLFPPIPDEPISAVKVP